MTPAQFRQKMKRIAQLKDIDERHKRADALMVALLDELGYGTGVELFNEMEKWYA